MWRSCAVRFYAFAMAEVPRLKPSGVRVHCCPDIPNQIHEMEFFESSNWGLATCAGASQLLYLVKGVRFKVSVQPSLSPNPLTIALARGEPMCAY